MSEMLSRNEYRAIKQRVTDKLQGIKAYSATPLGQVAGCTADCSNCAERNSCSSWQELQHLSRQELQHLYDEYIAHRL